MTREASSLDPDVRRGVVAVVTRDQRFLVIRRAQGIEAPGAYCFPGGGIEPGETEPQALVRELKEELNVWVRPVDRVWQSVTPWRVALAWWQAELPAGASLQPAPAEVASVHWYSCEELAALPELLESNRHFLAALRQGLVGLT